MEMHEISRLLDQMSAAYPNSKISPTKVLDLWQYYGRQANGN